MLPEGLFPFGLWHFFPAWFLVGISAVKNFDFGDATLINAVHGKKELIVEGWLLIAKCVPEKAFLYQKSGELSPLFCLVDVTRRERPHQR
jgi:hypothetical protein